MFFLFMTEARMEIYASMDQKYKYCTQVQTLHHRSDFRSLCTTTEGYCLIATMIYVDKDLSEVNSLYYRFNCIPVVH